MKKPQPPALSFKASFLAKIILFSFVFFLLGATFWLFAPKVEAECIGVGTCKLGNCSGVFGDCGKSCFKESTGSRGMETWCVGVSCNIGWCEGDKLRCDPGDRPCGGGDDIDRLVCKDTFNAFPPALTSDNKDYGSYFESPNIKVVWIWARHDSACEADTAGDARRLEGVKVNSVEIMEYDSGNNLIKTSDWLGREGSPGFNCKYHDASYNDPEYGQVDYSWGTCSLDVINPNQLKRGDGSAWSINSRTKKIKLNFETSNGRQICDAHVCDSVGIYLADRPDCTSYTITDLGTNEVIEPSGNVYEIPLGARVNVRANLNDPGSIAGYATFHRLDPGVEACSNSWVELGTDNEPPFTYEWDTSGLTLNGEYVLGFNTFSEKGGTWWCSGNPNLQPDGTCPPAYPNPIFPPKCSDCHPTIKITGSAAENGNLVFKIKPQGIVNFPDFLDNAWVEFLKDGNLLHVMVRLEHLGGGIYQGALPNPLPVGTYDFVVKPPRHLSLKFEGVEIVEGENEYDWSEYIDVPGSNMNHWAGDVAGDGTGPNNRIDVFDITLMINQMHKTINNLPDLTADANYDDKVSVLDLTYVVLNFGKEGETID